MPGGAGSAARASAVQTNAPATAIRALCARASRGGWGTGDYCQTHPAEHEQRCEEQPHRDRVTGKNHAAECGDDRASQWKKFRATRHSHNPIDDAKGIAEALRKIKVGSRVHEELWVPAERLEEFNSRIIGKIEVIRSFPEKKG